MNETYQVELEGQEIYINALVDVLVARYKERDRVPSIEEISREIRALLHIIIRGLKEENEYDTVVLEEETVYKGTYQLLTKPKGMLN